jgi:hypothetical protein
MAAVYLEFGGFEQDIARYFNIFCSLILVPRFLLIHKIFCGPIGCIYLKNVK